MNSDWQPVYRIERRHPACDRKRETRGDAAIAGRESIRVSPFAPKHPCGYPGCSTLTNSARCDRHRKQEQREYDNRRGTPSSRGYGYKWRIASKAFLVQHPLCTECLKKGLLIAATEVDHVIPHKGDPALFWNRDNWQSLCRRCHSRKTALTDGRWG